MRLLLLLAAALIPVLALGWGGCLNRASVEAVRADGPVEAPTTFDHGALTEILERVVSERGLVDYPALVADPEPLDAYLRRLAATDPRNLPEADRLAFWLNVYNAYTLKLAADNYPIGSLRDVVDGVAIPLVNSPFKVPFVRVGGGTMTLDAVEHGTIREEFDEPRIHFALVCAALSCPPLRAEAYVGERLEEQLDEQARAFLHDPSKNLIPAGEEAIRLSKIFDWFGGDFGGSGAAIQAYLAPYFEGEVQEGLERGAYAVRHLPYDWSLNDASRPHADLAEPR